MPSPIKLLFASLVAPGLIAVLAASCQTETSGGDRKEVVRALTEGVILPTYRDLDARATTLEALRRGIPLDDEAALAHLAGALDLDLSASGTVRVDGRDVTEGIRTPEVTASVSAVARVAGVRAVMVGH